MSVLLGTAATFGLEASALGLAFCQVPAGTHEVGDSEYEHNPPRSVKLDAFELADTPTTNQQQVAALTQLGNQKMVLMFESVLNRRWAIAARGTKEEIEGLGRAPSGDFMFTGALQIFDWGEKPPPRIVPVTLEPHWLERFDGDRQPALMSFYEAAAMAALFNGFILPTREMWEAAAGELRDRKYWDERELRKVAHFRPAEATAEVKTKAPNRRGLFDMLGNVREWTANRYQPDYDDFSDSRFRELRGGSWGDGAEAVRAVLPTSWLPATWHSNLGCRFGRQDP